MVIILVSSLLVSIIWGVVVNKVIENKGYDENWFWWGFFFGVFALIIALTKQNIKLTAICEEKSMKILSEGNMIEKVDVYSPIHIVSWSIKKDDHCDAKLFVDFLNVSEKTVSAVKFSAIGLNSFGERIFVDNEDSFDIVEQDLIIKPGEYGSTYIVLFDSDIRKVDLKVNKICFTDGKIYENNADKWININQSPLDSIYVDCAKTINPHAKFYAISEQEYWQCVCGFVNVGNECKLCSMKKEKALEFSEKNIEDTYQKYNEELKEEERTQEEKRKLKRKKHIRNGSIVTSILCVCIIFILILNQVIIPNKKYKAAKNMVSQENYAEAVILLNNILFYKDSMDLKQFSLTKLREKGSDRVFVGGDNSVMLKSDGTVLAIGDNEYGQCDVEEWEEIVAVSVDSIYTVGLKLDGTVVATGDNKYGQCNVQEWKDIVAITTAFDHTVGLKSDGTVVATGNNEYGQCNVQEWKDIVAITTDLDHTVGLKSDGTVVAVGNNRYGRCNVQNWKDIVAIFTGYSHTVGLKKDGTVVATGANGNRQCEVQNWKDIIAVSVEEKQTVGLKSDGTVVVTGNNEYGQCDVQEWKDIVFVFAGYEYTIGVKLDGTVVVTGDDEVSPCYVQEWEDIVMIWEYRGFIIGLKMDGSLVVEGDDVYGRCDINNWNLFK